MLVHALHKIPITDSHTTRTYCVQVEVGSLPETDGQWADRELRLG